LALINPFRGVRYNLSKVSGLSAVCAPPYDVIDDQEKRRLEELSPYNSVRLILPDDEEGSDRFAAAAAKMNQWIDDGILIAEEKPVIYAYTMSHQHPSRGETVTRGVIASVKLDHYYSIVPHEKTLPKPLGEQMRLIEATRANLSPIYLLAVHPDRDSSIVTEVASQDWTVIGSCEEPAGVRHTLSRINDRDVTEELCARLEGTKLVIADGHHRYEVARSYHEATKSVGSDQIMAFLVDIEEASHSLEGTHRVLLADSGISVAELERRMTEAFDGVREVPVEAPTLHRLLDENCVIIVVAQDSNSGEDRALRAFCTERLEGHPDSGEHAGVAASFVHRSILGGLAPSDIVYEPSLEAVVSSVSKREAIAGVLLPPPSLEAIIQTAESGRLLPQKSTFFYPKPRTGAVFRLLDL
jgi:uncharacterized protein (DUF1015 family)